MRDKGDGSTLGQGVIYLENACGAEPAFFSTRLVDKVSTLRAFVSAFKYSPFICRVVLVVESKVASKFNGLIARQTRHWQPSTVVLAYCPRSRTSRKAVQSRYLTPTPLKTMTPRKFTSESLHRQRSRPLVSHARRLSLRHLDHHKLARRLLRELHRVLVQFWVPRPILTAQEIELVHEALDSVLLLKRLKECYPVRELPNLRN